jgi:hypothetical protein
METAITERQSTALASAWIDRLFERFAVAYGTEKFAAIWRGQRFDEVKAVWATELGKFSGLEIRAALDVLPSKHATWPPTLFEFIELCRPRTIDPEAAFHEALRGTYARRDGRHGEWSQRAVYWASLDVSAHDMLNLTWPQIRARWTRALDARLADPNLPVIPAPPPQLPAPEAPIASNVERVTQMLTTLTGQKRDHRGWVQKILDAKAAGKAVSDYAYRMALKSADVR